MELYDRCGGCTVSSGFRDIHTASVSTPSPGYPLPSHSGIVNPDCCGVLWAPLSGNYRVVLNSSAEYVDFDDDYYTDDFGASVAEILH